MKNQDDCRLNGVEYEFKGNFSTYNEKCECDFWENWCCRVCRAAEDMRKEDLGWK